jgi:2,4-dienoyl-CoA reductase (NADPH2)
MVSHRFPKLFEPGQIGSLRLKNRLVRTAAGVDYLDENDFVKLEQELPFYEALARGGVGLIGLGGTIFDYPLGAIHPGQPRFDDDKFMPGYQKITEVVHKYDCRIYAQIHHAGPIHGIFNAMTNGNIQPVSSSGLSRSELQAMGMDFGMPLRELSVPEIQKLEKEFADAAERAKKAGFDAVEINDGGPHLGNSFLSPAWNRRHDEYGCDSLENRARFVLEVLQEIKNRLGQDFPLGIIMNGAELGIENGITIEDAREFAKMFEKAGVDYIQVRACGYLEYHGLPWNETIFAPEAPKPLSKLIDGRNNGVGALVPLAAKIKEAVSVPVITVGRLDPETGEDILRKGKADFIAMQRRLIADPELPNKAAEGRLEDIAPCLGCLACHALLEQHDYLRCRINAAMGGTQDYAIEPATEKKKVVIIGGGPSGMEAARVAALRGHEVTLYEKEPRLGGLLNLAAIVKYGKSQDFEDMVRYLKTQITKLGVNIKLGKAFDSSAISETKPDVVLVAAGGIPVMPEIPGIQSRNVISTSKLHGMLKFFLRFLSPGILRTLTKLWMPVGKRVVILGGGLHGCELTEFLVKRGRKVTMMDTAETLEDKRIAGVNNRHFFEWTEKKGVTLLTGVTYEGITGKGITIITREGNRQTIEADTIIPIAGMAPNDGLYKSLKGKFSDVVPIGDCASYGLTMEAVASGYRVARRI